MLVAVGENDGAENDGTHGEVYGLKQNIAKAACNHFSFIGESFAIGISHSGPCYPGIRLIPKVPYYTQTLTHQWTSQKSP